MIGIDMVLYNSAGCELERETITRSRSIELIIMDWENIIDVGDVIKFEEREEE